MERYDELLLSRAPELRRHTLPTGIAWNYGYYAASSRRSTACSLTVEALNAAGIFPRRYFWPILSEIAEGWPPQATPIASDLFRRVLVLPLHGRSEPAEVERVATSNLHGLAA